MSRLKLSLSAEERAQAVAPIARSTELPGTGGQLRLSVDDFRVEELLGFEADGIEGRHLLVSLTKREVNTKEALARVAKHCRLPAVEFGVAGLKDRHALTTQWITAPAHAAERLSGFDNPQISLGEPRPHSAKLRRGHAWGNRFSIVVRAPHRDWRARLEQKIDHLAGHIENFYGPQRFGHEGKNLDQGLRRLSTPHRARDSDFFVNAAQSAFFNLYALARREAGLTTQCLKGELLIDEQGNLRSCPDAADATRHCATGWTISGPMIGGRIDRPEAGSAAGEFERDILSQLGVSEAHLSAWGSRVRGARRPLTVNFELTVIQAVTSGDLPAGYRVEFALRSGAYATSLLNELIDP